MTEDEKSSQKGTKTAVGIIVIGCLLVFLLVVCIICGLTILGPQIGNVFSQITYTLETTPIP